MAGNVTEHPIVAEVYHILLRRRLFVVAGRPNGLTFNNSHGKQMRALVVIYRQYVRVYIYTSLRMLTIRPTYEENGSNIEFQPRGAVLV